MQEQTQYEPSPIATDPHTGKQYNFQPLFDYVQEMEADISLIAKDIQGTLDILPYAFLRVGEQLDESHALSALENMKALRLAFQSIGKL